MYLGAPYMNKNEIIEELLEIVDLLHSELSESVDYWETDRYANELEQRIKNVKEDIENG